MRDADEWVKRNNRYLALSLKWLCLKLEKMAEKEQSPINEPSALFAKEPSSWLQRIRAGPVNGLDLLQEKPPDSSQKVVTAEQISEASIAMDEAESEDPPPALIILSRQLGLSTIEKNLLLLCAAMELDTGLESLCIRAQNDPKRAYPTFALALSLFDDPAWDMLSSQRPLRYWQLIEIHQAGALALASSPLRADERIVNYIKGLNQMDDRLASLLTPLLEDVQIKLPSSQKNAKQKIVNYLRNAAIWDRSPIIQLLGSDKQSKQLIAKNAAVDLGLHLYRLPMELLPAQGTELERLVRLWQRESMLLPLALYLDASPGGNTAERDEKVSLVDRFLARNRSILFLDTRDIWPGLDRKGLTLDIARPTPDEQLSMWSAELGAAAGDAPAMLAGQFDLDSAAIQQISRAALAEPSDRGQDLKERIWDSCLDCTRPQLDVLAQRIRAKATWEDIVLPEEELSLLHQISEQVRQRMKVYDQWGFRCKMNRGLGISALFAGDSGTGKTMAAEVLANELRLNLYRIDLSAVVSKYIGETEKNLRKLFDAAENSGAILFFDEADALFGKRSEVKDSHDRYANIEISYLLQRMEAFQGLAILTTNLKSALDKAFQRRLRFVVNFPFPGIEERNLIWKKAFPSKVPLDNLDFHRLARLNLAGGSIHNVALNAAFMAASAGRSVTMPIVLKAARTEFRKLDRPVNEADFKWEMPE